jgi:putative ABC transport system ATP-binding protein
MAEPILAFEGISLHSSEGEPVFEGLSFSLERGQRWRLDPRRPGSATTALLRLAAGLAHPQAGRVLLDGTPHHPTAFAHPALTRGLLGWVPTGGNLIVNLSLEANVALPLRFVGGLRPRDALAAAHTWLERAGLADLAGRRPHALEPLDRWMGALARCAAMGASLWLVDRPPTLLDETAAAIASELLAAGPADAAALIVDPPEGWAGPSLDCHHLVEGRLRPGSAP